MFADMDDLCGLDGFQRPGSVLAGLEDRGREPFPRPHGTSGSGELGFDAGQHIQPPGTASGFPGLCFAERLRQAGLLGEIQPRRFANRDDLVPPGPRIAFRPIIGIARAFSIISINRGGGVIS